MRGPGSATSQQAGLGHLEDADLVGRAEPVLRRPQEPQRGVALALEVDDGVDQVLERLRAGDRAVLGDVADEDHRDPVALREIHQPQRRLADLADAPGRARRARRRSRSGSSRRRPAPGRSARAASTIRPTSCSARTRTPLGGRHRSSSPSRAARRRTWPGDSSPVGVQDRPAPLVVRASPAAAWSRSVDLPIPGSPPTSTSEPGHEPAAQDAVELVDPEAQPRQVGIGDRRPGRPARAAPPTAARSPAGRARVGSRTTVSTRVFQPPQARHWPSQRRNDSPHVWQT